MASMHMKAAKCPTDELSLSNYAIANRDDFPRDVEHVHITTAPGQTFLFSLKFDKVNRGTIGFNLPQRKWATISLNQDLEVRPYYFDPKSASEFLSNVVIEADFLQKKQITQTPFDSDQMAKEFILQFAGLALTAGQQLVFSFQEDKPLLSLMVKSLEAVDPKAMVAGAKLTPQKTRLGLCRGNTTVQFEKAETSGLNLTGQAKGMAPRQSIINPDWDFQKMGIGGLDKEFNAIFRRAFASRVFPPEIVEQLGEITSR